MSSVATCTTGREGFLEGRNGSEIRLKKQIFTGIWSEETVENLTISVTISSQTVSDRDKTCIYSTIQHL
jgi:hypothetical protein